MIENTRDSRKLTYLTKAKKRLQFAILSMDTLQIPYSIYYIYITNTRNYIYISVRYRLL